MKRLNFAEVRGAGLPAHTSRGPLIYVYHPLNGEVAVYEHSVYGAPFATAGRVPAEGWLHEPGCGCRYCRAPELPGEKPDRDGEELESPPGQSLAVQRDDD